jgi:hypothetical protein
MSAAAHFDLYQFGGLRKANRPVSQESGIAFSDYERMQTHCAPKGRGDWFPPFAFNEKQLQRVLLVKAWSYVNGCSRAPETIDYAAINAAATVKAVAGYGVRDEAPQVQREMQAAHITAVQRAGGYLELQAAVAFRAWRLGQTSVEVAASLGITPFSVRVILQRLRDTARSLGFDVGAPHPTRGKCRKPAPPATLLYAAAEQAAEGITA